MVNLEMLRSLYDFKATYAKTLSFKAKEYFILHQTNTKHKNWWEVVNESGEMGFIPSNYVEKVNVSPAFYLHFIDNCIENIKRPDYSSDSYVDRNELLIQLQQIKTNIEQMPDITNNSIGSNDSNPLPPLLFRNCDGQFEIISKSSSSNTSVSSENVEIRKGTRNYQDCLEEPIKPVETQRKGKDSLKKSLENIHEEIKSEQESCQKSETNIVNNHVNDKVSPIITTQSVYELVESVRINTQLSHEMSKVAVQTVVQGLHDLLPAATFPYLSTILSYCQTSLIADEVHIDQTHDASRLKIIFNELTSCKEDSQQRSWMLHEDEDVIKEYLGELTSILSNADASICKHVISQNHYYVITTLIQYYQMEVRWSIRQLLLQAFGVLCSLDKTVINIMLNSVLPGELARDMMTNPRNIPKLNYSALLLTMVFSMGESMPITNFEFLGPAFVIFLLENIENPPDTDIDDQIPDLFLNLVISYNLQFKNKSENVVLNALKQVPSAKIFTEKILLLLNREEDPIRIFDHEPSPPHSVLKLFLDLFSNENSADLFYTNDIKVLIDIVVRNIADLSPGDTRRQQYLELCRLILRNTNYQEHLHRKEEFLKCFTRIFCEETEQSKPDQKIVKAILNEFPQYFK